MASASILLKAEAKKLNVEGYRRMSDKELEAAIASAKGTKGSAPAKGKAAPATNGAKGKAAAKAAVGKGKAAPAKGKAKASTSAPAKGKSTSQKSSPAKGKAVKGEAKRQTAGGTTKGKAKSTPAKGKAAPAKKATATPAKGKASAAKSTSKASKSKKAVVGRAEIDRKAIDWRAESRVGASGKRKEVMDALKKRKGSYDKVFEDLQDRARKFYPKMTKHDAERMLRWLINRVAYDFVMSTDQHTPGERAAFGTSDKPQDVRRRERRAEARKAAEKEQRAAAKAKGKSAPAKAASKGKAAAKKSAPAKGKASSKATAAKKGKGKK